MPQHVAAGGKPLTTCFTRRAFQRPRYSLFNFERCSTATLIKKFCYGWYFTTSPGQLAIDKKFDVINILL